LWAVQREMRMGSAVDAIVQQFSIRRHRRS
jgi:hypothetical protein